jgi:pyridoxine kinase
MASVKEAVAAVHLLGPKVVLVTSLESRETPADAIDLLAGEGGRFWRVRTPKLSLSVNGAGDAVAALFFVHYARSGSAATALAEASASIYGLLKRTDEAGSREILTVAAQDEFVNPTRRFSVEEV